MPNWKAAAEKSAAAFFNENNWKNMADEVFREVVRLLECNNKKHYDFF